MHGIGRPFIAGRSEFGSNDVGGCRTDKANLGGVLGPEADPGGLRGSLGGDEFLVVGRLVAAALAHFRPSVRDGFERRVVVADVYLAKLSSDGCHRVLDAKFNLLPDEELPHELARCERVGFILTVPPRLWCVSVGGGEMSDRVI
jgi:hypothetical protein